MAPPQSRQQPALDDVCLKSARIGGAAAARVHCDITARKEAEERRLRLEALREAQNGSDRSADRQDRARLQQPVDQHRVTSCSGSSPTQRARTARLAKCLGEAHRSCERARDLIQQMLMFSRGQRRHRSLTGCRVSSGTACPSCDHRCRHAQIETDLADDVPAVRIDALQPRAGPAEPLHQCRDALDGRGRLKITVRRSRPAGLACASCRHTFSAITLHSVSRTRAGDVRGRRGTHFRTILLDEDRSQGHGPGGIVHGIVHEHGGHVLVDTAPGSGARFRRSSHARTTATRTTCRTPRAR
jgi:light-regulated signal transduction histidine kinase (bacteriophytochrome)